jgi:Phytanoyl-CoA dioxygenase (PhyH)
MSNQTLGWLAAEDLPELSESVSVSNVKIEQYRRDGHLLIRQALAPGDIAAYRPVLVETANRELAKFNDLDRALGTSGSQFGYDLREVDRAVWRLITAPQIAKMAAELLEVPSVRLLHYNCFFKPPNGLGTPWHQDCLYIPLNTDRVIAAWIPLVELSPNMAPLTFASGSHQGGFCEFANTARSSPAQIAKTIVARGWQLNSVGSMAVGDISFHSSLTLHSAPQNFSHQMREVISISYYADGAGIGAPEHCNFPPAEILSSVPYRQHFLNQYFAGLQPGDLACSPTNPIVYPTSKSEM